MSKLLAQLLVHDRKLSTIESMRAFFILTLATLSLSLAAFAQPSVSPGGVLNGASFDKTQTAVAPGSLVAIFGSNLASSTAAATSVPLSVSLGNVQVKFGSIAAPLYSVSSGQINAQVPYELAGSSSTQVTVTNGGGTSAPQTVPVASAVPGIFGLFQFTPNPPYQAVAYGNSDYAFAAPAGLIPGVSAHPAKILDPQTLVILATGLGAVTPPLADGVGDPGTVHQTTVTPVVLVGNVPAQVVFSGILPGDPGVYQINIIVPAGAPTGNAIPIQIQIGGITTSNAFTIAVSN